MKRFQHSGKIGDCIFGLPAVRALGGGSLNLVLRHFHRDAAGALIPLLEAQDYVSKAEVGNGQCDYNLDEWRKQNFSHNSITVCHLLAMGIDPAESEKKWIHVEPKPMARVVMARCPSKRYGDDTPFWRGAAERHGVRDVVFLGLEGEARAIRDMGVPVHWHRTSDFLEIASIIAGSELAIVNQSSIHAVVEGLKHPAVVYYSTSQANSRFDDGQSHYVVNKNEFPGIDRVPMSGAV